MITFLWGKKCNVLKMVPFTFLTHSDIFFYLLLAEAENCETNILERGRESSIETCLFLSQKRKDKTHRQFSLPVRNSQQLGADGINCLVPSSHEVSSPLPLSWDLLLKEIEQVQLIHYKISLTEVVLISYYHVRYLQRWVGWLLSAPFSISSLILQPVIPFCQPLLAKKVTKELELVQPR